MTASTKTPIHIDDVTDTAFWVAHYRAVETKKSKALFKDPYAELLAGDKGRIIAKSMKTSRYVEWVVVLRTRIIDEFIATCIVEGEIDAVLNLGAGLDARPYRLTFPETVTWIEADYPKIIDFKNEKLKDYTPTVKLEQYKIDVANRASRTEMLNQLSSRFKKILVLTEGLVPYLTNEQTAELGNDLNTCPSIAFWIVEYFAPGVMEMIKRRGHGQMRNAPFQFSPDNWHDFFENLGWEEKAMRYFGIESIHLKRRSPLPLVVKVIQRLLPKKQKEKLLKFTGFGLLAKVKVPGY